MNPRAISSHSASMRLNMFMSAVLVLWIWLVCPNSQIAQAQQSPSPVADPLATQSLMGKWGDQGNGRFVNPILPGDFSDLDAIRVGDDFYAISSTMQYSPGMVVLHSRDLVNWQIVGHVVSDVSAMDPELRWNRMNRDGRGIWAGSLRYNAGRFWVYFGTPDGGIYMAQADRPEGPWSPPKLLIATEGWDDPCPFWDDDGKGYLIATRFAADADGQKYRIHLFSLNARSDAIVEASDRVVHQSRGSEANKLYKIGGVYFHYFSEVRAEGRVAMMERSRSLEGPWEIHQLNHVHGMVDKEPNQGGLIPLKDGSWWFLTHQGKGDWEGRAGVLLPVTWLEGWPILGQLGPDGVGEMVWGGESPVPSQTKSDLFVSDSFRERSLPPAWEWRYQPRPGAWSFTGKGLRMQAYLPLAGRTGFAGVRNVLTQRSARSARVEVTVQLDLSGLVDKQEAGLAHFAKTNCRIAIVQAGKLRRVQRFDQTDMTTGPIVAAESVWLRSTWSVDGLAHFRYSIDGSTFAELGNPCRLSWGAYRGDRVGLYTVNSDTEHGYVDFSDFQYEIQ